jgi:hypothetical protein
MCDMPKGRSVVSTGLPTPLSCPRTLSTLHHSRRINSAHSIVLQTHLAFGLSPVASFVERDESSRTSWISLDGSCTAVNLRPFCYSRCPRVQLLENKWHDAALTSSIMAYSRSTCSIIVSSTLCTVFADDAILRISFAKTPDHAYLLLTDAHLPPHQAPGNDQTSG